MIRRLTEVQQEAERERVPVFQQYQSTAAKCTLEPDRDAIVSLRRELPCLPPLNLEDEPTVLFTGIGDPGAFVAQALNPPFSTLFN
jgi:hypothetical protein